MFEKDIIQYILSFGKYVVAENDNDLYNVFNEIDDHLWPYLLAKEVSFPKINLLPDCAPINIQKKYHGTSGITALLQASDLVNLIKKTYASNSRKKLKDSTILDFGFGWGRILRFFYKEMPTKQIFGCDPSDEAISFVSKLGLQGNFAKSDFVPKVLPFDSNFDIIFSSSVFTHLSENSHLAALKAFHNSLNDGGMVFLTVRPPNFIERNKALSTKYDKSVLNKVDYFFEPNKHFDKIDGEYTYGHSIILKSYMEREWTKLFKIIDVKFQVKDPFQVLVVLQKR